MLEAIMESAVGLDCYFIIFKTEKEIYNTKESYKVSRINCKVQKFDYDK